MKRLVKLSYAALCLAPAAMVLMAAGCGQGQTSTSTTMPAMVKDVTPGQANILIQANQGNAGFVILDVRTPQEYAEGHIQGAINIDYNASGFQNKVGKLDKTKTYLVYCHTGIRSAAASKIMVSLGFKNVNNMTGGITDWQSLGFAVVK